MFKQALLFIVIFANGICLTHAQSDTIKRRSSLKPSFHLLVLQLSTTYFTVVKENEVDLDSSLIHISQNLSLSRLPIVAEGINDEYILKNAGWVDQRKPWIGQQQLKLLTGQQQAALNILIGAYFAFEPGNNTQAEKKSLFYLSAGIKECDEHNNIGLKLAGQRLLAKLYLKNQNFREADKLFELVKNGYMKLGDKSSAASTYSWWGLYAPVTALSTVPRIEHIEMATKIFKSLDEKEGQINSLVNDSYLYMLSNDMSGAEKLAKQALKLTQTTRFPYIHYVTGALMSITMFQGKFGEPLAYAIESVKSAEMTNDKVGLPYYYSVVAVLYENEGYRGEIAIDWEKKSINSFLSLHEPSYMTLNDMVAGLLNRGRQSEALEYIKKVTGQVPPVTIMDKLFYNLTIGIYDTYTKQWALAHESFDKAAQLEKKLEKYGLNVRKPTILINMAQLYFKEKNYRAAKLYYHQYLAQPSIIKGGFLENKTEAYQNLIKIDSIIGDHQAQLMDYSQFMGIVVRNYTVSKTRLAEELQVKYATTARINQIKLLNQKAKLEQENLKQANVTKNITIAGIVLLIFLVALLYRQAKIRKKNSEIIIRKNKLMQKLLDEKEWLVKEIHHRVKNNLHTIICLLESQAVYLENDALKAIENSQHRIYAMSLIHQKLYQSDDIKVLDMKIYLAEFVAYLRESFGSPEHIVVTLLADEVRLGAAQAIPVGLIINEAISNAFKYAFPAEKKGEIKVELKRDKDNVILSVKDNGVGFKQQPDQENNSLGLELIKGLTSDLRGTVYFNTERGTDIQIRFTINRVGVQTDEEEIFTSMS